MKTFLTSTAILAGILSVVAPHAAQAGVIIAPAPGYSVTWDGNDGVNFDPNAPPGGAIVPDNLALASNGSTPFADPALVLPHEISDLNNGFYGNTDSYIGTGAGRAGIVLPATDLFQLTSIAWGRDNGHNNPPGTDACGGGQCTDRKFGLYTLYRTTVAGPGLGTPITGVATTGWQQIGTFNYQSDDDAILGGLFTAHFRHEYDLLAGGRPIPATGIRLDAPVGNALDEIELFGIIVPEPASGMLALLGLLGLATGRRRRRRAG